MSEAVEPAPADLRGRLQRTLQTLPPGTIAIGLGLGILGVAAYVFLAFAGHSLSGTQYSGLSVLWVFVFAVGPGIFLPLEQELGRVVSGRAEHGQPPGAVVLRVAGLAGPALLVLLVLLFAGIVPLADALFAGNRWLVVALGLNLVALSACHLSRGVLTGTRRFVRYGSQLAIDGSLRSAVAVVLFATGSHSPAAFGFGLAGAQLVSVAVTALPLLPLERGPSVPWREVSRGLGLLLVFSLASQLVVNIGVILIRLIAVDPATAGEFLSGSVLARIPLFVFSALQASLLPSLARAVATGDTDGYRRGVRRALLTSTALGLLGLVVVVLVGPPASRVLFGAAGVLSRADFLWLSVGTTAYMLGIVCGQAVVALGGHREQAIAWTVGLVVLLGLAELPLPALLRIEVGYTVGSLAVVLVLVPFLRRRRRTVAAGPDLMPTPVPGGPL